ncbi:hypothetical protein [Halopseudomonas oceani]|uniref:hypothetical protein n=1 Tax=Halopseudomonas oceani TaxID=1708783 RepID=UPI002AA754B7|nr:hypothetical protein [Halopseudomonas oceani]
MPRKKHPKKEIEEAVSYAESKGWTLRAAANSAHAWGMLYCPSNDSNCRCGEFCITSVSSTPRSPSNHARLIKRVVNNCTSNNEDNLAEKKDE